MGSAWATPLTVSGLFHHEKRPATPHHAHAELPYPVPLPTPFPTALLLLRCRLPIYPLPFTPRLLRPHVTCHTLRSRGLRIPDYTRYGYPDYHSWVPFHAVTTGVARAHGPLPHGPRLYLLFTRTVITQYIAYGTTHLTWTGFFFTHLATRPDCILVPTLTRACFPLPFFPCCRSLTSPIPQVLRLTTAYPLHTQFCTTAHLPALLQLDSPRTDIVPHPQLRPAAGLALNPVTPFGQHSCCPPPTHLPHTLLGCYHRTWLHTDTGSTPLPFPCLDYTHPHYTLPYGYTHPHTRTTLTLLGSYSTHRPYRTAPLPTHNTLFVCIYIPHHTLGPAHTTVDTHANLTYPPRTLYYPRSIYVVGLSSDCSMRLHFRSLEPLFPFQTRLHYVAVQFTLPYGHYCPHDYPTFHWHTVTRLPTVAVYRCYLPRLLPHVAGYVTGTCHVGFTVNLRQRIRITTTRTTHTYLFSIAVCYWTPAYPFPAVPYHVYRSRVTPVTPFTAPVAHFVPAYVCCWISRHPHELPGIVYPHG